MVVTHGSLQRARGRCALTIGSFDGVQRGPRAALQRGAIAGCDARFAALSAERFIKEVLVDGLRMQWLLIGRDFRFGERRAGDYAALEAAGARYGFALEAMPDVLFEGERV